MTVVWTRWYTSIKIWAMRYCSIIWHLSNVILPHYLAVFAVGSIRWYTVTTYDLYMTP